jgi:ABC-2 type transport system permease protein
MMAMLGRYIRLLWIQLRTSLTTGMQYRWDFLVEGLMAGVFALLALLPLWVFQATMRTLEGWSFPEMVVVVGWFTLLKGILDGAVNPALIEVVEKIRQGTLDFVLLKPADAQFLVSTAKFVPWKAVDVLTGVCVLAYGFTSLGRWPLPLHVLVALVLLVSSCLVLYSIWILVVSAAFWVVRLDNLAYLFTSLFDFARWPVTVFRGLVQLFFTFVIPLALMTTYPAMALLGKLSPRTGLLAVAGAVLFAALARLVWLKAISKYTSASS